MNILIDKLESTQKRHKNSSTDLDISRKRYKKVYFLTDINKKMW